MAKSRLAETQDRRRHFRLRYPSRKKPKLVISDKEYEIIDVSEGDVKFSCPQTMDLGPDAVIRGALEFSDGQVQQLQGRVLGIEVVMELAQGPPDKRVVKEQIRIRCQPCGPEPVTA